MPSLGNAVTFLDPLNAAMTEFQVDTPPRIACFIAQVGHESGDLRHWRELWGPTTAQRGYEGRADLGNTEPGDGFKFRGRGPIQVTGRSNYQTYGDLLGLDLINHPELLEDPTNGFRAAGMYWKDHGLNELADLDTMGSFAKITRRINGGLNGFADRVNRFRTARKALGLAALEA